MASNILIKFDGIDGESVQADFNNWIEAQSLSFGINAPPNIGGQGLGSGKGTPTGYTLTTEVGTHSPKLMEKMLNGTHHTTVTIKVLKTTGANKLEPYFTLDGTKGYVEHLSWSAGPDGKMYENISVQLETHKWEYKKQSTDDGSLAAVAPVEYNVQQGTTAA